MSDQDLLTALIRWLDAEKVEYFLTGSMASGIHGEPRATHDIDVVVSLETGKIESLVTAFPPPRYYLDPRAVAEAIRRQREFNLIDSESGLKVDFWNPGDQPFERSAMRRRVRVPSPFGDPWVASPEDTILAKLRWSKALGGSEQQWRDVRRVYEVMLPRLNQAYLDEWAANLGVTDLLIQLRRSAEAL